MSGVQLTARGEMLLLRTYAAAKVVGVLGGFLLLIGVAGWIEGA